MTNFINRKKIVSLNSVIFAKKYNIHDVVGLNRSDFRLINKNKIS